MIGGRRVSEYPVEVWRCEDCDFEPFDQHMLDAHRVFACEARFKKEKAGMKREQRSILQDWVMALGLRHQGVLLGAVRGCDTAPKEDPSKGLVRALRAEILETHCANPNDAKTFIEPVGEPELQARMQAVSRSFDHLPAHYVLHLVHAAEVIGYHCPYAGRAHVWLRFYERMCSKLHMTPETKAELDARLNADETTFAESQR